MTDFRNGHETENDHDGDEHRPLRGIAATAVRPDLDLTRQGPRGQSPSGGSCPEGLRGIGFEPTDVPLGSDYSTASRRWKTT